MLLGCAHVLEDRRHPVAGPAAGRFAGGPASATRSTVTATSPPACATTRQLPARPDGRATSPRQVLAALVQVRLHRQTTWASLHVVDEHVLKPVETRTPEPGESKTARDGISAHDGRKHGTLPLPMRSSQRIAEIAKQVLDRRGLMDRWAAFVTSTVLAR